MWHEGLLAGGVADNDKKKISLYAVITALTVAVSMVFIIPVPATNGFVTLADAGDLHC